VRHLVIAVDCDDVLTPTAEWILRTYEQTFGVWVALEDFYSSNPKTWGATTHEQASARVASLLETPEYAAIKPYHGAVEVLSRLRETHELHLVTGRPKYLEPVTGAMLDRYFPSFFQSVNHTSHFEGGKRGKGEVCAEIGADLLIDDHIVHLNSVQEANLQESILFGDYPWNQIESLPAGVVRCATWAEVEREVARIVNQ